MYGLKATTSLSFLVDRKMEQLRIGLYEIQLRFDGDVSISVQSEMIFENNKELTNIKSDEPAQTITLWPLLGDSVLRYAIIEPGSLVLNFRNHRNLTICDTNTTFESYVIWEKGNSIAV